MALQTVGRLVALAGCSALALSLPAAARGADPTFTNTRAAVLGVFAELDNRVNAGRDTLEAALTARGLTHELVTVPGVDHAFFNDTGPRFNAAAAATTYQRVLDWFGQHMS